MRKIYLIVIGALLFASCSLQDNYNGEIEMTEQPPTFDLSTAAGQKKKEMFDKYGLIFNASFSFAEYEWDWSNINIVGAPGGTSGFWYTLGEKNYIPEVLDSLEAWFFNVLPEKFISDNLPRNIYLCDSLLTRFAWLGSPVHRHHPGDIKNNFMMLGWVSDRFDEVKEDREHVMAVVSLFVERMVQVGNLTIPYTFVELSLAGFEAYSFTNAMDVIATHGILRKGRKGQNSGSGTAAWYKTTPEQDFGDFVSFIIYLPEDEKELVYAKNPIVKQKVGIVEEYFETVHGITLPKKPRETSVVQ